MGLKSAAVIVGAFIGILAMLEILIYYFHFAILSYIITILFFVILAIAFVLLYLSNSRAFRIFKIHPILTTFLLIGLLITSPSTGLFKFLSSPSQWTIPNFMQVMINIVQSSQYSQQSGQLGGFAVIGFFFGVLFTVFIILFIYDLLESIVKMSLQHSVFPLKVSGNHMLIVISLLSISILLYSSFIWVGTAIAGHFEIDPFFGTVSFIRALILGKVNISYLTPSVFL